MVRGFIWAVVFAFVAITLGTRLNNLSVGAIIFLVGVLAGSLNELSISCRHKAQIGLEVVAWSFVLTGIIVMAVT